MGNTVRRKSTLISALSGVILLINSASAIAGACSSTTFTADQCDPQDFPNPIVLGFYNQHCKSSINIKTQKATGGWTSAHSVDKGYTKYCCATTGTLYQVADNDNSVRNAVPSSDTKLTCTCPSSQVTCQ